MRWEKMQKPLRDGCQAFRLSWPDMWYVMVEDGILTIFTAAHPEGVEYTIPDGDLNADDWAATGPSGG